VVLRSLLWETAYGCQVHFAYKVIDYVVASWLFWHVLPGLRTFRLFTVGKQLWQGMALRVAQAAVGDGVRLPGTRRLQDCFVLMWPRQSMHVLSVLCTCRLYSLWASGYASGPVALRSLLWERAYGLVSAISF
jgi:hypothetical protein